MSYAQSRFLSQLVFFPFLVLIGFFYIFFGFEWMSHEI